MRNGLGSRRRQVGAIVTAALVAGGALSALSVPDAGAKAVAPRVLYVYPSGTPFAGISTPADVTFTTIQGAVSAAHKGDWILVAPGDYHETDDVTNPPTATDLQSGWYGGVDIETPDVHLRGMNRNSVIVDGTLSTAALPCSPLQTDQNTMGGNGRNGILVWKASGVTVDNLTVCNFLAPRNPNVDGGNEIWWNGGAGSGKIGLKGYEGSYLTATSTYFAADNPTTSESVCSVCALYGIFASDSKGKGSLSNLYANNFSDSGMYIGACIRVCGVTITNAWMENSALGYSGTNSGGQIQVENSKFDNNKDGFDTNTALTGDPPPPQDGRCTGTMTSPITGTTSCWVVVGNLFETNNNPNVPIAGTAGLGPTGTGMTISGGRNDTVMNNQFLNNGAWGVVFIPYPDPNTSSGGKTCSGTKGITFSISGFNCLYDPMGDALLNNQFSGNGTFGNPSNADFGNLLIGGHEPTNCFSGNTEWNSSFTTQSGNASNANVNDGFLTQTPATCGSRTTKTGAFGANTDGTLLTQVECDADPAVLGPSGCSSAHYPQATAVVMQPLPGALALTDPSSSTLASMPNPCVNVPSNLWCPGGVPASGNHR